MKTTIIIFLFLAFAPFVFGSYAVVENSVKSSANTGGNSARGRSDGSSGGSIVTGDASASVEVKTQTSGNEGTTKVEVSATANGDVQTVSEEFEGGGSIEINARASSSDMNYESGITRLSATEAADNGGQVNQEQDESVTEATSKINIVGEIISALKNFFSYVVSIFKW